MSRDWVSNLNLDVPAQLYLYSLLSTSLTQPNALLPSYRRPQSKYTKLFTEGPHLNVAQLYNELRSSIKKSPQTSPKRSNGRKGERNMREALK